MNCIKCLHKKKMVNFWPRQSLARLFCSKNKKGIDAVPVGFRNTRSKQDFVVRLARPIDTPNVLKFVREHAKIFWGGIDPAPSVLTTVILSDFICKSLSQGQTLLATKDTLKTELFGNYISGIAIGNKVSPWDANIYNEISKCVISEDSKNLLKFHSQCLRKVDIHQKYNVKTILQVILIVPESPKATELCTLLIKAILKRGKDYHLPILRFDVTNFDIGKILEKAGLKKEKELSFTNSHLNDITGGKKVMVYVTRN